MDLHADLVILWERRVTALSYSRDRNPVIGRRLVNLKMISASGLPLPDSEKIFRLFVTLFSEIWTVSRPQYDPFFAQFSVRMTPLNSVEWAGGERHMSYRLLVSNFGADRVDHLSVHRS